MTWLVWFVSCELFAPSSHDGSNDLPAAQRLAQPTQPDLPAGALAVLGEAYWGPRWPDAPQSALPTPRPRDRDRDNDGTRREGAGPRQGPATATAIPLEGGRWATCSAGWCTLWDAGIGALSEAPHVGPITPDAAWVVGREVSHRLDPEPVRRVRHHHDVWWNNDFAAQVDTAGGIGWIPLEPGTEVVSIEATAGGWLRGRRRAGIALKRGEDQADFPGCRMPEEGITAKIWWSLDATAEAVPPPIDRIACATDDGMVVFDRSGRTLGTFHADQWGFVPTIAAFAPGRDVMAVSSRRGEIVLWTPSGNDGTRVPLARGFGTPGLTITDDGSLLIAVRQDGGVALIDTATAERVDPEVGGRPPVAAVAVATDGSVGALDTWGVLRAWGADLKPSVADRSAGAGKSGVRFGPGAAGIVCATSPIDEVCWGADPEPVPSPPANRWTVERGAGTPVRLLLVPPGGHDAIPLPGVPVDETPTVIPSPSNQWVLVQASRSATVDIAARRSFLSFSSLDGPTAIDDSGHIWVADGPNLRVLDTSGFQLALVPVGRRVTALAAGTDTIVTGHPDGTLTVWDLQDAKAQGIPHQPPPQRTTPSAPETPRTVDLTPDLPPMPAPAADVARVLARGDRVELHHGDQVHPLDLAPGQRRIAAPDGSRVAVVHEGTLSLQAPGEDPVHVLVGAITELAFSHDGRWIATAGERGVLLIDPVAGAVRLALATADVPGRLATLGFSADGATLTLDGAWSWSVPDGAILQRPLSGRVSALAVDDDGTRLAVGTEGGDVVLVDLVSMATTTRFDRLGAVRAVRFTDAGLWVGDRNDGSALLDDNGAIRHRHSWPWTARGARGTDGARATGLRIDDDGLVGVFHRGQWWGLDWREVEVLDPEVALMRPTWIAAVAPGDPLWFSGPGIAAPSAFTEAPCGVTVSVACNADAVVPEPPTAAGLQGPRPSPTGAWILGHDGQEMILRSPGGEIALDGGWSPGDHFTWTSGRRLIGVSGDKIHSWRVPDGEIGSGPLQGRAWSLATGTTRALAASGDRIVRVVDRVVVAETLGRPDPTCVAPAPESSGTDRPPILAISPDARYAAVTSPSGAPQVVDLEACEVVFPSADLDEATVPVDAQAVVHRQRGWRFGEQVDADGRLGWVIRQDASGRLAARAKGAKSRLSDLDPTGTHGVTHGQVWSLDPLEVVRTFDGRRRNAVVSPAGHLAWLDSGNLMVEIDGTVYPVPHSEIGRAAVLAFAPAGTLVVGTVDHRVHLLSTEDIAALAGGD